MNIIELFLSQSQRHPHKIAVCCAEQAVSYQALTEQVKRQSAYLAANGVQQGDHVLLILENSIEFLVTLLTAAELGAVIVPLSPGLNAEAIATAVTSSEATHLISYRHKISKLLADKQTPFPIPQPQIFSIDGSVPNQEAVHVLYELPDSEYQLGQRAIAADVDFILTMTSGSTSAPKPIVFTQQTKLDRALLGARDIYQLTEDEVILTGSPMHHSLGQRLSLLPLLLGGQGVILEHFTAKKWLTAVQNHGVTFTIAVSSQLEHIYQATQNELAAYDLSTLRCLVSSSALLKTASKQNLLNLFQCELHECYGASEVGIVTNLSLTDAQQRISSVGKPLPYVQLKIVDDDNKPLPIGQVGEISCATRTLFSRYFNNPQATAKNVVDGFFKTGDMGYMDAEDYLYFCDRKKDIIIVGGTNVYPKDIEQVLNTHPDVKESAVVGIDDDYFGDIVSAFIVAHTEAVDLLSIKQHCLAKLADFQQPMVYTIVQELPKNAMGKVMKQQLRATQVSKK